MSSVQPTKRIGELLVGKSLITRNQLDQALMRQQTTKEFLGTILVQMGAIEPDVLQATLAEQFHLPQASLAPEQVDWAVPKSFPNSVLADGKCFPFRQEGETVTVAVANPLDAWALSAVEDAAGFRKVKAVLVSERELQAALQAYRQRLLRDIGATLRDDR